MVTSCSPRPMRVVQRARLWAITCTASQAPLAAKRPEGRWLSPTPYLRSRMAFSISAWRRWSASSSRVSPSRGDEAVIAVAGEEGQLGAGRGLHPPDDEPHRCGVGLILEGDVGGLRHVGGAVHPVGNRRPVRLGYGLDDIPQAFMLADGDGVVDIHLAADGDDGVDIEAAVSPHRELSPGASVAYSPTVSRRKWAAPRTVLARPLRSRAISTSPVPAAMASSG